MKKQPQKHSAVPKGMLKTHQEHCIVFQLLSKSIQLLCSAFKNIVNSQTLKLHT